MSSGWDRASIAANSRPIRSPERMSRPEVFIPQMPDGVVLLGACLVCGACISVLWIYIPAWIVAVMINTSFTPWIWLGMASATLATGLGLFFLAAARERDWAAESPIVNL